MTRVSTIMLLLGLAACAPVDVANVELAGDVKDVADDRPEGPLHPDTFLIEEHPCFSAAFPSEDNSVIDFEFDCDAADVGGLEVGRIVSGTSGGGYLRRIDSLELTDFGATAWTSPATLTEALVDVDYSDHIEWGARQVVDLSGRVLDESITDNGRDARAVIERGVINIDPALDIDAEIAWFSLKSATALLTVNLGYDVEALMEAGSAMSRGDTLDVETLEFPFETDVGPITVTGKLDVIVRLQWSHDVTVGEVSNRFGFQGNGTVVMGGKYTSDGDQWERHWEPAYAGDLTDQIVTGGGTHHGAISVQIEALLTMDKVDGSTFRYTPWNSGSVDAGCEDSTYWADAGLKGSTTMKLGFFDDGPRVEEYPELNIETERREGLLVHETEPAFCTDGEIDLGGPGDDDDDDDDDDSPEVPGECNVIGDVECGSTLKGDTATDPYATSNMDGYPCNVGNYDGPEMTWRFVAPYTGQVEVAFEGAVPTDVNHDILILDGQSGACMASECIAQGFNSVTFDAQAGHAYFFVVDGFYLEAGAFVATVNCGA
ncbi:MAG: hypothetical protein GY898_17300 [Proteobacteria bacterium]|nr:hypothetical protein [Pseudomonadota bacterium]